MKAIDLVHHLATIDTYKRYGRVKQVVGIMIESKGPTCSIGDICYIYPKSGSGKKKILGEVVGFKD